MFFEVFWKILWVVLWNFIMVILGFLGRILGCFMEFCRGLFEGFWRFS